MNHRLSEDACTTTEGRFGVWGTSAKAYFWLYFPTYPELVSQFGSQWLVSDRKFFQKGISLFVFCKNISLERTSLQAFKGSTTFSPYLSWGCREYPYKQLPLQELCRTPKFCEIPSRLGILKQNCTEEFTRPTEFYSHLWVISNCKKNIWDDHRQLGKNLKN